MADIEKEIRSIAANAGDARGRTPGTESRSKEAKPAAAPRTRRKAGTAKSAAGAAKKTTARAASAGKKAAPRRPPGARASSSTRAKSRRAATITPEKRRELIAEAAYFRAEERGFSDGSPEADWLAAEAEIDAKLLG